MSLRHRIWHSGELDSMGMKEIARHIFDHALRESSISRAFFTACAL